MEVVGWVWAWFWNQGWRGDPRVCGRRSDSRWVVSRHDNRDISGLAQCISTGLHLYSRSTHVIDENLSLNSDIFFVHFSILFSPFPPRSFINVCLCPQQFLVTRPLVISLYRLRLDIRRFGLGHLVGIGYWGGSPIMCKSLITSRGSIHVEAAFKQSMLKCTC